MSDGDDDRVVVIGSGPCGAIVAASLVDRGLDVLLLDAGTHVPRGVVARAAGNIIFRWVSGAEMSTDRLDPASEAGIEWYSSLSLGGLSNYWTAAVPRFAPSDFAAGASLDERYEWPVTYDELVPFYERAERHLSVTAGMPIPGVPANVARYRHEPPADWARFAQQANDRGHSVGAMPMAKGGPWMFARRGTEFNSYDCIVAPLLGGGKLELRTGADVVGLRWSSSADRADAVEYVDHETRELRHVRARAIVVAAGVIDTTMLLLRSTSADFPAGLGNSDGLVGRYLHDHPREWWVGEPSEAMTALAHPIYVARDEIDPRTPLHATALTIVLASRSGRLRTYIRGKTATFGVQVFGTMVPGPEQGITLTADEAAGGPRPRPTITLRYDDATVADIVSARARLQRVFRDAQLDLRLPGPFHELTPGSSVHYGGTVRMHASREFGALDRWSRLRDVRNVVVADSSAFTTGPEKNPTLTAMALSARAADHLADDLAAGTV